MVKFSKVGLLVAMLAISGLFASSASAVEWHTSGHQSFTTTTVIGSRLAVHPVGGGSIVVIDCANATGTGTLRGPTINGSTISGIATVTPHFGGPCTVSGAAGYSASCNPIELNAHSYSGGRTFPTAGTGVTHGTFSNIDCRLSIGAVNCSTITGAVTADYINPEVLTGAGSFGRLTVTTGNLTVSKIGVGCAAIPHGQGTFGSQGAGSTVGDLSFIIHGTHAPWLFQTL